MGADAMKMCPKCEESKPVSLFWRSSQTKDGLYGWCKCCARVKRDRWAKNNPDLRAASTKRAKQRNPELFRARKLLWLSQNPDKATAQRRSWVERNREGVRAKNARWQAENADKYRLSVRRAISKRRALGTVPTDIFESLLKLQRGKCTVCRDPLLKFHLDHIMPVARGGTNDRHNFQLLCPNCNQRKSARHPVEFMQSRGFLL